jgi:hypothetical protein
VQGHAPARVTRAIEISMSPRRSPRTNS